MTCSVLGGILKHFAQSSEDQSANFELVLRISHYIWFTEAFSASDGEGLLGDIVLNIHPDSFEDISRLLGDQIVFSRSKEDLDFWISCSYTCLQSLGACYGASQTRESETSTIALNEFTSFLRKILIWVWKYSAKVRGSDKDSERQLPRWKLELEEIATEQRHYLTDKEGNNIPLKEQNFDFIPQLSPSEWEGWLVGLRTILMGTRLGGLGIEPLPEQAGTLMRNPDRFCGRILFSDHLG
jgi:hypothetical protein